MLGENIDTSKANKDLIKTILKALISKLEDKTISIAIYGESGSGKSVLSHALFEALQAEQKKGFLLQLDDYFVHPPKQTSALREQSLDNVGPKEVNLSLLDNNIAQLMNGDKKITKPEVNFHASTMEMKDVSIPEKLDFVLVEGTYSGMLKNVDYKIFIDRNYQDTHIHRVARMREPQTELIEKVLEREHQIVSQQKEVADIVIDKTFKLVKNEIKSLI